MHGNSCQTEDSWKEERDRLFCGFTMDVADEQERSMLIGKNLSHSRDSETRVLAQCGLSVTGNFKYQSVRNVLCTANLTLQ